MTANQTLEIRKQLEAIYPSMKKDALIDTTWLAALRDESFASAKWACKEMVRTRYPYVPNLTAFLTFYDKAYDRYTANDIESDFIRLAIGNGYLDGLDKDHQKRTIQKIINWEDSGLIKKLKWLVDDIAKFQALFNKPQIENTIGGYLS